MERIMDRDYFYELMHGEGTTDYERYLNTKTLFSCQSDFSEFCNGDELQFQIVHQIQELLMKLIAYTLLDIDEYIKDEKTNRIITLFQRVYRLQEVMIKLFDILDTMSPKEYQEIRIKLGGGSGRESPGFRALIKMGEHLWYTFKKHYLEKNNTSIEKIYNSQYSHSDAFMVAEALATYDELFQKFRFHHVKHVQRSIGLGAKSLKGNPVSLLEAGLEKRFFPELWQIRDTMTDQWLTRYGEVRDSLKPDQ
jgi:tryptophan 2,3-dioxygenase